ncbi:MAG: carboxypeptidase regulatory-like domain-containing protein [Acidobacteria bacterium]|nr:carboxypeptidase regulatory-like domain-containing protein [Acidobacteriota bacterium]
MLLIAACAVPVAGQERRGPIAGVVVDPMAAVVVAATVVVEGDGGRTVTVRTSVDGRFSIQDPPAGVLVLRVTATASRTRCCPTRRFPLLAFAVPQSLPAGWSMWNRRTDARRCLRRLG